MSVMMAAVAGQMALGVFGKNLPKGVKLAGDAAAYGATYIDAKNGGRSAWGDVGLLAAWNIGAAVLGTAPMMALMGAQLAGTLAPVAYQAAVQNAGVRNQAYLGSFGGGFQMSETAATMRDAGVKAIQENGYNLRSVLGSESRRYVK
jgi:hypothetical protein